MSKAEYEKGQSQAVQASKRRTGPVVVTACPDYSEEHARAAVCRALEKWPGLSRIRSGVRVAVKVNLVTGASPKKAVTTHPQLVTELCRQLILRGAEVTVGDSPGGLFTREALRRVYRESGMEQIEQTGAKLNDDIETEDVTFPGAAAAHVFSCTSWLRKADVVINFAKLKSHGMMRLTASVKNLFGAVPGTTKPEYHMRFPNETAFANMLIDLNEALHPDLDLVDAVVCMEGNGPTAGSPRPLGLVLSSENPYNLDMVCAELIGLRAEDVPTIRCAAGRGLGPSGLQEVEISGERPEQWKLTDFRQADGVRVTFTGNGVFGRLQEAVFRSAMQQVPKVHPAECVGCGKCFNVCPARAITMVKGKPKIDRKRCIRCFCCQEFCPKGAMKVHRTALARLLQ